MRSRSAAAATAALCTLILFAAPAVALPVSPGDRLTPSPRLVCAEDGLLEVAAAKAVTINGHHPCFFAARFDEPVTVVAIKPIGGVDFADRRTSDAFSVRIRFDDGTEGFALFLEAVPGIRL